MKSGIGVSPKPRSLIDAMDLRRSISPRKAIIRGDSMSISIAAASIIAKVKGPSYQKLINIPPMVQQE